MGNPDSVPAELRETDQWICWRTKTRDGKKTKIPVEPATGGLASTDDPMTWTSFREALQFSMQGDAVEGIGFVFTDEDPFVGVDLDDCREPESGEMDAWATNVIQTLDSYAEVSPSGTGAHVLIKADKPGDRNRKDNIEMYETGRYFTVTGAPLPDQDGDIEQRQQALDSVYHEYIGEKTSMDTGWLADDASSNGSGNGTKSKAERTARSCNQQTAGAPSERGGPAESNGKAPAATTDSSESSSPIAGLSGMNAAIVQQARSAENGEKLQQLWKGNWEGRYESHSEADMALCSMLAFWTAKNPQRMETIFRQSGLMREKWDADRGGKTYGELTISKALGHVTDTFDLSNLDLDDESEQKSQTSDQPSDSQPTDDVSHAESTADPRSGNNEDHSRSTSQADNVDPDRVSPVEATRRDPDVRRPHPDSHDASREQDTTHTQQSTSESKRRTDSSTSRTTTDQYFEDWYSQLLDFQGSVPPWVEQIARRIQELEGEVDRNEQLIRYWKDKAEQQEEEIQHLQQRVHQLEAVLDVEHTACEQPPSEPDQSSDSDDDSSRFGFLGL